MQTLKNTLRELVLEIFLSMHDCLDFNKYNLLLFPAALQDCVVLPGKILETELLFLSNCINIGHFLCSFCFSTSLQLPEYWFFIRLFFFKSSPDLLFFCFSPRSYLLCNNLPFVSFFVRFQSVKIYFCI